MKKGWVWGVVAGVALLGVCQLRAEALVLINEVLADPAALSGDANGDGIVSATQDEFIELVNTGGDPVSLNQWTLSDLVEVRHLFSDTAVIPSHGFFVVFGGGSPQGVVNAAIASSGGLGLNNTGDTLTLRDAGAVAVDAFTYGAEGGMDVSLTRSPDATGPFVKHNTIGERLFSPGTTEEGLISLLAPGGPADPEPPDADEPDPFDPPSRPSGSPGATDPSPVVPEPSSLWLMGTVLLGVMKPKRRRPTS